MTDIKFNSWYHQSGTGGVYQDSSGNLGIGSDVPSSALDVQGSASFGVIGEKTNVGTATSVTIDFNNSDGVAYVGTPTGPVSLYINNIPTTNFSSKLIPFTVIINQNTTTAYACSSVYFNGTSKTIRWSGGSVGSGSTSAIDYFSFVGIDTIGDGAIASYTLMGVKNGNYTLY